MVSPRTELIFSHEASSVIRKGDADVLTQLCFCRSTVCNYLFKNEHSTNPLIPDILVLRWSNKQIKSYLHITNEFWKRTEIIPSESPVPGRDGGASEWCLVFVEQSCVISAVHFFASGFSQPSPKLTCNSVWKKNFCGHCEQS